MAHTTKAEDVFWTFQFYLVRLMEEKMAKAQHKNKISILLSTINGSFVFYFCNPPSSISILLSTINGETRLFQAIIVYVFQFYLVRLMARLDKASASAFSYFNST